MYLILKSDYCLEKIEGTYYIKKIDQNLAYELSINHDINKELIMNFLHFGIEFDFKENCYSKEEKVIISLLKLYKEFFLITHSLKEINFEINCRNIFMTLNLSNASAYIFKRYKKKLAETCVSILSSNYESISKILNDNNIRTSDNLDGKNAILICEDTHLIRLHYEDINKFECIIPFSVNFMSLGHCIFRKIEFDFYKKEMQHNNIYNTIPSSSNLNVLYNLILSTTLHIVDNVHHNITMDVGLPINKKLQFSLPYNELRAHPII